MPRTALLVAAFDSQLKWCARIRDELVRQGFTCRAVVPEVRTALSPTQVRDAGFESVDDVSWDELVELAVRSEVVVTALAGPQTRQFTLALSQRLKGSGIPGPVVVAGWVGIIIEKITAGYLDRCGADIVAVNSADDLAHFQNAAEKLGLPSGSLLLTGLPFLSPNPAPQGTGPIRTVLFADQPTVPAGPVERGYVYTRLLEHARRHPERRVLLKPRHRPNEDTFHQMRHHPADLLAGEDLPSNFEVVYTPVIDLLPEVDLLVTVSSTACLEAVDHGCRVALVLDLGVHERLGNQVFIDSGLLRTFDQIDTDDLGSPDPRWRDSYFGGREHSAQQIIVDRAVELLVSGERPSHGVWESAYFRGIEAFATAREQRRGRWSRDAWSRRKRHHGRVMGTVVHVLQRSLPPVVAQPLRRWATPVLRAGLRRHPAAISAMGENQH